MRIETKYIEYNPGGRTYRQKISGKKNYYHTEGHKSYNGYGGVHETIPSELKLYGICEDNSIICIDIKYSILNEFDRSRLSEEFINKFENCKPKYVNIKSDCYGNLEVSKESLQEWYTNMYPRKAKNKYR